jgi:hypothetical protein
MTGPRAVVVALTVIWLAALGLVVKTGIDRLSAPPWGNVAAGDLSPEVTGSTHVGQAWRAPLPGLYRIEVSLQPPATAAGRALTFHLRPGVGATSDLWTATLDTGQLVAGSPYAVEFGPLRDSKGQEFYFYLESTESQPGEGVRVVYGPGSVLDGGSAYVDGQQVAGNLAFQTHYSLRTRDKVDLLLERMAQGRPYLLGTKGFYVALALLYGLLLLLFLWHVGKSAMAEDR